MLTENAKKLYDRQIILKHFGESAQSKLLNAKVLVVGAGGLGCPVLQYLAGAGVGTLYIIDSDTIEASNLHRQPLYTLAEVGQYKSEVAAQKLKQLNPNLQAYFSTDRFKQTQALEYIPLCEVVVDCSDNFETRYLLNDACVLLKKPLVYGAISQYEGQVSVFNQLTTQYPQPANYRNLYPRPPLPNTIGNCAETGVLGMLAGIIGSMQAMECIKIITGIGNTYQNQLFTYDALNNRTFACEFENFNSQSLDIPLTQTDFLEYSYDFFCTHSEQNTHILSFEQLQKLAVQKPIYLVDVRELGESPNLFGYVQICAPLSTFEHFVHTFPTDMIIIFVCQAGKRSL
jgi:sulfur-carrier protein adenylyltransferase/sulfurtransferase